VLACCTPAFGASAGAAAGLPGRRIGPLDEGARCASWPSS
jgi:hypothetical protein